MKDKSLEMNTEIKTEVKKTKKYTEFHKKENNIEEQANKEY